MTVSWPLVWYGAHWPQGQVKLEIEGRGSVLFVANDRAALEISQGDTDCSRPEPCGGSEWAMKLAIDGQQVSAHAGIPVELDRAVFTSAYAFTHDPDYHEPDEEHAGTASCEGPETELLASLVRLD